MKGVGNCHVGNLDRFVDTSACIRGRLGHYKVWYRNYLWVGNTDGLASTCLTFTDASPAAGGPQMASYV